MGFNANALGGEKTMMQFGMADFAAHMMKLSMEGVVIKHEFLEHIGKTVEKAAKDKIGEYQDAAGQFQAWPELAESTKADRVAQGFSENEPLLRTGQLRESIEHTVGVNDVQIGSDLDYAVYQELGTERIPSRSYLGGAAFEQAPKLCEEFGVTLNAFLCGDGRKTKVA